MMRFQNHCVVWIRTRVAFLLMCTLALGVSQTLAQSALTLEGKSLDPFRASPAKPTVLIFVRTDCPISNRYAPVLQELAGSHRADVSFWLVYPDRQTTPQAIRAHLHDYQLGITPIRDPDHVLVKLSNATATPEAAVFNSRGRLVYHGRIDNTYIDAGRSRPTTTTHELKEAIESALSGKTPMPASAPAVGCYISDTK